MLTVSGTFIAISTPGTINDGCTTPRWDVDHLWVEQLANVTLGWSKHRVVGIIRIRRLEPLPGGAFSGFRHQRHEAIQLGRERTRRTQASRHSRLAGSDHS